MKLCFIFCLFICLSSTSAQRANVLLIIVDDLRADLEEFCQNEIKTPSIDKLKSEGTVFERAYCQKALCVPSRQSFLTGLRPDRFGAGFNSHFRKKLPDHLTLPQYFKSAGYRTYSIGKVFHHRDDRSWSEPSWVPEPDSCYPVYGSAKALNIQQEMLRQKKFFKKDKLWWAKGGKWVPGLIWDSPEVEDSELTDGKLADYTIQKIRENRKDPFFIAVGFFRPHLPFIAPKKYYDLYPLSAIRLPQNKDLPAGSPALAAENGGEWRKYYGVPQKKLPGLDTQKEYIRAYLASVSYVDAQIGRLLQCLDSEKLTENTTVVLMSDHGYHLFDNNSFGKSTNFEDAVRVLLTVKTPESKIKNTKAIVELVDLYPSLCDLSGLKTPASLDGISFKEVLHGENEGKKAAFSQYSRRGYKGYSVRTDRFRYTEWRKDQEIIRELYDFKLKNPETENAADDPQYKSYIKELRKLLDN